jgi:hypothetical protein
MAETLAAELYGGHPAAAALILEGFNGATQERRLRSARALACLDPDQELLDLPITSTMDAPARAIAVLLVHGLLLGRTQHERAKAGSVLAQACEMAEKLYQRAEPAA